MPGAAAVVEAAARVVEREVLAARAALRDRPAR